MTKPCSAVLRGKVKIFGLKLAQAASSTRDLGLLCSILSEIYTASRLSIRVEGLGPVGADV